jgi:hypothetical protein
MKLTGTIRFGMRLITGAAGGPTNERWLFLIPIDALQTLPGR